LEGTLQEKKSYESSNERKAQRAPEPKTDVPSVDSSTYKPLVTAPPLTSQWTPPYFAVRFNMCHFIFNKFIMRHDYKRWLKL